ncbi:hypothetical protein V6N12_042084 [Hibiscus sabdariffa]|uniref:Uncharacterized protein n=1 Tax=Hibiscus sabdariffa TaxID=183260 RepID=A0ABR2EDQ8_9ROSI
MVLDGYMLEQRYLGVYGMKRDFTCPLVLERSGVGLLNAMRIVEESNFLRRYVVEELRHLDTLVESSCNEIDCSTLCQ